MTVYAYLRKTQKQLVKTPDGDKVRFYSNADFTELRKLDEEFFKSDVEYFSIQQQGTNANGFFFVPGHY